MSLAGTSLAPAGKTPELSEPGPSNWLCRGATCRDVLPPRSPSPIFMSPWDRAGFPVPSVRTALPTHRFPPGAERHFSSQRCRGEGASPPLGASELQESALNQTQRKSASDSRIFLIPSLIVGDVQASPGDRRRGLEWADAPSVGALHPVGPSQGKRGARGAVPHGGRWGPHVKPALKLPGHRLQGQGAPRLSLLLQAGAPVRHLCSMLCLLHSPWLTLRLPRLWFPEASAARTAYSVPLRWPGAESQPPLAPQRTSPHCSRPACQRLTESTPALTWRPGLGWGRALGALGARGHTVRCV